MIERITIRNFKSLGDVTVDLDPTTVLVGASGVGKSNLFRAVRFVRDYLLHGNAAFMPEGGWQRIHPFGKPAPMSIAIVFRLPGYPEPFSYELAWTPQPDGQMSLSTERLTAGDTLLIGRVNGQWLADSLVVTPDPGTSPTALGNLPSSTESVLAFSALANGLAWHEFPSSVLRQSDTRSTGAAGASTGQHLPLNRGLNDSASNYPVVLLNLTHDLRDQHARRRIVARLRQMNPSVVSAEVNSLLWPTTVIVGHKVRNETVALDLSQESDGFRRYYAHLLALYQTPPKQVLMFEEPENGIAPGALRNLAEEFRAAPADGRGQVLLSTQSPELLDGFEPEQIRVVDLDPETQLTRIGRLAPDQVGAVRDNLLHPGELLTVDVARREVGLVAAI